MKMAAARQTQKPAYQQAVDEILSAPDANARTGLSQEEAVVRLARYSRNELTAEPRLPAWRRFLAQFSDVLVILLLVAAVISSGLWVYERDTALPYEALAISATALLNAATGFIQESRVTHRRGIHDPGRVGLLPPDDRGTSSAV